MGAPPAPTSPPARERCSSLGRSPRRARPRFPAASSVAAVPLLFPRVTVVVVAVVLPEARLVGVAQLEAADPLGALPEVDVRDEQPGGAAVFRLERLARVLVGNPGLPARQVFERQVRCV